MPETEFTGEVMRRAAANGLLAHHCGRPQLCQGPIGFLDTIIAGQHGVLFAEQKSATGQTTAEQDLWIWTVHRARRVQAVVWEPADLDSGLIDLQLRAII